MTPNESGGLRERKKVATREALRAAALRLALENGPENVRVDDIAEAAGVSPRTYNNYFASREQAIAAAILAERATRIAAAVRARPTEPLAEAVTAAVVDEYTNEPPGSALDLIMSAPRLRAEFIDGVSDLREPLTSAIEDRVGDPYTAAVLAAAVSAAAKVAVEHWARPSESTGKGFLVVTGEKPLAELLRDALAHVAPALRTADS
jgi:AcrR family transcriptional regulator